MFTTGHHATGYHDTPYFIGTIDAIAAALSRTYQTLVLEARWLLLDEGPTVFRYTDTMLINILNRGLHELSRIRPDAYYDLFSGNDLQVPEVTDSLTPDPDQFVWTRPFDPELRFYPPLVHYVVGIAQIIDDAAVTGGSHVNASMVAAHLRTFRRHVLSV